MDARSLLPGMMDERDRQWLLNDLTPITRREGLRRSPHYHNGISEFGVRHPVTGAITHVPVVTLFYECCHYDRETRRCLNYEHRPPVCSGYPWYDERVDPAKALPEACEYRRDIGQVPVALTTKAETARG